MIIVFCNITISGNYVYLRYKSFFDTMPGILVTLVSMFDIYCEAQDANNVLAKYFQMVHDRYLLIVLFGRLNLQSPHFFFFIFNEN
jgi:hypothetical protein